MLDLQTLVQRAAEIESWSHALTADADLLIYGCDIAATQAGEALVSGLAALTGADVAASDDTTGHASLGGDWDLEHRVGPIETNVAVSAAAQASWTAALADHILVSDEPKASDVKDSQLSNSQSWGQSFVYDSEAATYSVDKLGVMLSKGGLLLGSHDVTVSLRSTWNGAVIASGTVSSNALTTSPQWVTITLNTPATLTDNATYVIRIDGPAGLLGSLFVGTEDHNNYAGGTLIDNGVAVAGKEMAFRVIDTDTADVLLHAHDVPSIRIRRSKTTSRGVRHSRFDSPGATYSVDKIGLVIRREAGADPGQIITVSIRSSWTGAVIAIRHVRGGQRRQHPRLAHDQSHVRSRF